MKIKLLTLLTLSCLSSLVYATEITAQNVIQNISDDAYITCKNNALTRKNKMLEPAHKEYVAKSTAATEKTKKDSERIKWYVESSYKKHSQDILEKQKKGIENAARELVKARTVAENTWRAEDSLCELQRSTTLENTDKK